jgi:uncharacterized membrane protein YeaQ/YmgE (transglycosylase-associated protein family)
MPLWTILVWLVIGGLAGFSAQKIMGGSSANGLFGDIVLGILGAVIGGYGLSLFGVTGNGGIIATFVVAVLGAMALIWIVRKLKA